MLSALIKKNEKTNEDARLGLIQMIGALQDMPKASPQGSKAGKRVEVFNPHRDKILEGE